MSKFGPKLTQIASHAYHFVARHVLGGMPRWQDAWRARGSPTELAHHHWRRLACAFGCPCLSWSGRLAPPLPPAHSVPLSLAPHSFPVSSGRVAMATMAKRVESCCHSRRHSLFPSLQLYSKPRPSCRQPRCPWSAAAQAGPKPDVSCVVYHGLEYETTQGSRCEAKTRLWAAAWFMKNPGFPMQDLFPFSFVLSDFWLKFVNA